MIVQLLVISLVNTQVLSVHIPLSHYLLGSYDFLQIECLQNLSAFHLTYLKFSPGASHPENLPIAFFPLLLRMVPAIPLLTHICGYHFSGDVLTYPYVSVLTIRQILTGSCLTVYPSHPTKGLEFYRFPINNYRLCCWMVR